MMLYCSINEISGLCIVRHFTRGDDSFNRKLGFGIHNEMDFVSEEGVGLCLMTPSSIWVRILSQTLTFASALTYFDAKPVGVSPEVGGINGRMNYVLDDTDSNGLSNELVKYVIEQLRTQSFTEVMKGDMRRNLEEVEPTQGLESDIELEFFS
jgi:hypothetical protein